jgi:hypothetical protein
MYKSMKSAQINSVLTSKIMSHKQQVDSIIDNLLDIEWAFHRHTQKNHKYHLVSRTFDGGIITACGSPTQIMNDLITYDVKIVQHIFCGRCLKLIKSNPERYQWELLYSSTNQKNGSVVYTFKHLGKSNERE